MTSTYSTSHSNTFTRTDAIYLASKVAADLHQLGLLYGDGPTEQEIKNYAVELAILVQHGCVSFVEYGYKRGNSWAIGLKYVAGLTGTIMNDERPGQVPTRADVSGAVFSSYLEYSDAWFALSNDQRSRLADEIPVFRTSGYEPKGAWSYDRVFSRNGVMLSRGVTS